MATTASHATPAMVVRRVLTGRDGCWLPTGACMKKLLSEYARGGPMLVWCRWLGREVGLISDGFGFWWFWRILVEYEIFGWCLNVRVGLIRWSV